VTITNVAPWVAARGGIIPVPNIAARNALGLASAPTSARPLYVDRADAPPGIRLEVTADGTTWRTVGSSDWITATLGAGWALVNGALAPQYRVIGDVVELRGSAMYAAGLTTAYVVALGSMPPVVTNSGDYPLLGGVGVSRIGTGASLFGAYLNPRLDGAIRVAATGTVGTNTVLTYDGVRYRTSAGV